MAGISKAISAELLEKAEVALTESSKQGDVSRKLQAIKSAKKYGIKQVSDVFGVSRLTILNWIKDFASKGTNGLKLQPGRGRKCIINAAEKDVIKGWIANDCNLTIKILQEKIESELGKKIGRSATHNLMRELDFSYITPRPAHYKGDKDAQIEFKKNLKAIKDSKPNIPIYFFDESRFGTHSKIGHGWFKKGERTAVKVKLGFLNFYLYSAIAHDTGENFSLIAPNVNTACMNIFLQQFNEFIGGKEAMIVMDGAGWHKSKELSMPPNITAIFLPPYSPELNPVERFWQFIKQNTIKNRVFEDIDLLMHTVANFVISIDAKTITSVCSAEYLIT